MSKNEMVGGVSLRVVVDGLFIRARHHILSSLRLERAIHNVHLNGFLDVTPKSQLFVVVNDPNFLSHLFETSYLFLVHPESNSLDSDTHSNHNCFYIWYLLPLTCLVCLLHRLQLWTLSMPTLEETHQLPFCPRVHRHLHESEMIVIREKSWSIAMHQWKRVQLKVYHFCT